MAKHDNGGAAFPQPMWRNEHTREMESPWDGWGRGGMSLRAYMATAAMQGLVANPVVLGAPDFNGSDVAKLAYHVADALLSELAKEGGE